MSVSRLLLLLLVSVLLPVNAALAAYVVDHHDDAALFVVPTAHVVNPAQPVHSLSEYETVYGRFAGVDHGALAAELYFANGGQTLYVLDPGGLQPGDFQQALDDSIGLPVSMVAFPGASCCISDPVSLHAVMQVLVAHATAYPDRFAIIDAPRASNATELLAYRAGFSGKYAALYAPWLVVDDATASSGRREVPPSAAVAGVIARVDREQGIFESPAGVDVTFSPWLNPALERNLAAAQDNLNLNSVNVLREFTGVDDPVIWGARVLDADSAPYISRYRYLRHLEHSIHASLRPCFDGLEPNCPLTEAETKTEIDFYLFQQWQQGVMAGATPADSWFTQCTLGAADMRCLVGVALLRPAEFDLIDVAWRDHDVIFRTGFEVGETLD